MLDDKLKGLLVPRRPQPTGERCRGGLRRPVATVLFDLYGTLLISASGDIGLAAASGGPEDALNRWVSELGFAPPAGGVRNALTAEIKKTHQRLKSRGVEYPEVIIEKIWGRLYPQASAHQLQRLALAYELKVNPVCPMPGLRRCLAALSRSGIRLGIVSNAQFYTPLLMEHFLGGPLTENGFSEALCFYSFRLGTAKPGAALYRAAAEGLGRLGIAPQAAVMVGNDRRNDVAAARAVGFQTVLFAGDARSLRWRDEDPDWSSAQPDMVITKLTELSDYLEGLLNCQVTPGGAT
jgi:putative hydrolase of the HAD superfamily